jgi:hypothetical protein
MLNSITRITENNPSQWKAFDGDYNLIYIIYNNGILKFQKIEDGAYQYDTLMSWSSDEVFRIKSSHSSYLSEAELLYYLIKLEKVKMPLLIKWWHLLTWKIQRYFEVKQLENSL